MNQASLNPLRNMGFHQLRSAQNATDRLLLVDSGVVMNDAGGNAIAQVARFAQTTPLLPEYQERADAMTAFMIENWGIEPESTNIFELPGDWQNPIGEDLKPDLTIKGFDSDRYNQHDSLIIKIVDDLNSNKIEHFGLTETQAKQVPDIDPLLIKAWMIQESGGNDSRSKAAWIKDPLQVNVPGIDWSPLKQSLGLVEPTIRNTGDLETNIQAGIIWMVRKGYGVSATAPNEITNRPNPTFDGFFDAIRRYNGRSDITATGGKYSVEYANRVFYRYNNPDTEVKISIKNGE